MQGVVSSVMREARNVPGTGNHQKPISNTKPTADWSHYGTHSPSDSNGTCAKLRETSGATKLHRQSAGNSRTMGGNGPEFLSDRAKPGGFSPGMRDAIPS